MNLSAHTSTIFSRNNTPPPPLTKFKSGSTSSAPSIATSNLECVSNVTNGMPNSSACSFVRTDVGMHTMSFNSPDGSTSSA